MSIESCCPNQTEIAVRFTEVDPMGIANHGAYFAWAQEALAHFMSELLGLDPARTPEVEDFQIPAVEVAARFYAPARYRDRLMITTYVEPSIAPSFLVHHQMHRLTPEPCLVCELRSWHVLQRADGSLWARIPSNVQAAVIASAAQWPAAFHAPATWRPTPHRRQSL